MDALSPLFQDIEFRERLRGYDVEEVDAFVDRVARAAALVQGRISELQERADAAESRISHVNDEEDDLRTPVPEEHSMSRMLVIAQRTADAAIAEAEAEAARIRAEADEHASRVLAEAETDRRRLLAEAEADAVELADRERSRLSVEIAALEEYKAFVAEDVEILETHLADARLALASSLSGLTDLLEQPEAFRLGAMPAVSGAVAPEAFVRSDAPVSTESEDGAASEVDQFDALHRAEDDGPSAAPLAADPAGAAAVDAPDEVDVPQSPPSLFSPRSPGAVYRAEEESGATPAEGPPPSSIRFAPGDEGVAAADSAEQIDLTPAPIDLAAAEATAAPGPPLLVTAADLGAGSDAGDDLRRESGPVTQPVPVVAEAALEFDHGAGSTLTAEPLLEQLREAVEAGTDPIEDDAISAFFDDEQGDEGRSWFSRRR